MAPPPNGQNSGKVVQQPTFLLRSGLKRKIQREEEHENTLSHRNVTTSLLLFQRGLLAPRPLRHH